jgi:hypothetical protein
MAVFTIPFDYNETDKTTVPICVRDTDDFGNSVHFEWIEQGVVPVAHKLVKLAARVLHDGWRASEIVEPVVFKLSLEHGANVGYEPSARVYSRAEWFARDLKVGGRRARRKTEVELFVKTMESVEDEFDFLRSLTAKDTLDRLLEQLTELGMDDVRAMVPMILMECDAREFQHRFKKSRNAVSQQFFRGMRKAAQTAGIVGRLRDVE